MASKNQVKQSLRSKIRWGVFGTFVIIIAAVVYILPAQLNRGIDKVNDVVALGLPRVPEAPFSLGLDLQGGAHLVYSADVSGISGVNQATSVEGVREVIERRINGIGVGEPSIQTTRVGEEYRLVVELPGVTDIKEAISRIGETPILEFREENKEPPRQATQEDIMRMVTSFTKAEERAKSVSEQIVLGQLSFDDAVDQFTEVFELKKDNGSIGFVNPSNVDKEVYDWLKNANEGDISEPVRIEQGFLIVRKGGERLGTEQVEASHILICYLGAERCTDPVYTKEEALSRAQELLSQARADNFASLASEFSTDRGSAAQGGSLGKFGRGAMVPAFEEAAYLASVGEIVGPIESNFGYHIIYKTGIDTPMEYAANIIFFRAETVADIIPPAEPYKASGLSGSQLEHAEVVTDPQTGSVQVSIQFNEEGTKLFEKLTEKNLQKPMAIYLDGEPISIPVVQQVIRDGRAVISGSFDVQTARLLSQRLNAGALPVPVELISQQSIGATLGEESLVKSLKAGMIAMILVMIFMIIYYRLPGVLSVLALGLYMSVTLALFKLIGVTLTLAGIAGFVLSIGMAVDANVLIFERLREELKDGKSLKLAIEEAFVRAWTSIRDGNVSTLITCVLLIWFGSSFVKGFAVTLSIGIVVSMFSAVVITRILLRFVEPWFKNGSSLFLGNKKK
jgi:protein-export membrane protein SecD